MEREVWRERGRQMDWEGSLQSQPLVPPCLFCGSQNRAFAAKADLQNMLRPVVAGGKSVETDGVCATL